jgi:ElaB/YqjD/DUF883 family membrane-anchored ribosome-binding protein
MDEKVRNEVENLRDNLSDLSQDDSDFADNLYSELESFEESMNDLKEDMSESGEQISMEVRQAVNDLQVEARSLRMKIERRTDTDNDPGMFGDTDDAVSGEQSAQAQRDTSASDTTGTNENMPGDARDEMDRIGQEIETEFQNFKQNLDQWVDRLSAKLDDETQRYD